MSEYVLLIRFTHQGIEKIKESPNRLKTWKKMLEDVGAKLKAHYLVLGQYDMVHIIEAPDDETVARLSLQLGSLGNIRMETLRAFNENQYVDIISKVK